MQNMSTEMNADWSECKNILCIRPDNMGDLLMTTPALRALKESLACKITILTSSMAAGIAKYIPLIDDILVFDVPWVKTSSGNITTINDIVANIKQYNFDAAIVFTVYSQNPIPSIMLAYLAGIPKRLAYCRENPYQLLTDWLPDKEPYSFIQHQVRRDLLLVKSIGATTSDEHLSLQLDNSYYPALHSKLERENIDTNTPWMILHAGVSEEKRKYPTSGWIRAARRIRDEYGYQLLFTGSASERSLTDFLAKETGALAYSLAGRLCIEEFILLIKSSSLVISVNTGTIHLCAALGTPVIVLYALTNPQHTPWKVRGKVLTYDIPEEQRSRNEIIRFVHKKMQCVKASEVTPSDILRAVKTVLIDGDTQIITEMIPLHSLA